MEATTNQVTDTEQCKVVKGGKAPLVLSLIGVFTNCVPLWIISLVMVWKRHKAGERGATLRAAQIISIVGLVYTILAVLILVANGYW